jgi:hypothetical protein
MLSMSAAKLINLCNQQAPRKSVPVFFQSVPFWLGGIEDVLLKIKGAGSFDPTRGGLLRRRK